MTYYQRKQAEAQFREKKERRNQIILIVCAALILVSFSALLGNVIDDKYCARYGADDASFCKR